ncbi:MULTISPECIES: YybH family protein [Streptomyces]|uniref:YybH family protein n=2 Tax=Streptomyces TaxID=1883 RepID=A0ABV9J9M3_9ACTN
MNKVVQEMVERWRVAFNGHQPDRMAELFAPDALFQGFGPDVLVGRDAVRGYYEAVPVYRTATDVSVLHSYAIGVGIVGGFVGLAFRDPKDVEDRVHLSLLLEHSADGWQIRQYHVSRVGS